MMRSMFSADGKQWVYGDAFGVTRLDLGKKRKVSKHTIKFHNGSGAISMSLDGKLGLHNGHEQVNVYGSDALVIYGLPALGIKQRLTERRPAGLYTGSAGDRVVLLDRDALLICAMRGDALEEERRALLSAAPQVAALALGPNPPSAEREEMSREGILRMSPDGRYVALTRGGMLAAGKLGGAAYEDEDWWRCQLTSDPLATVSLEIVGREVWVTVMDYSADEAYVARINEEGAAQVRCVKTLCPPAATASHLYTQPDSATIVRLELATGATQSFDVSAHNLHPRPDHDDKVYKGAPRPAAPTRLPGYLAAQEGVALFVPWHAEVILELLSGERYERGLEPEPGAFRRLIQELMARDNEALRPLNIQVSLRYFEHAAKHRQSPLAYSLPSLPTGMAYAVACHVSANTDRYDLSGVDSWGWGSMGGLSNLWPRGEVSVEQVRSALALMRRADWLPFEVTRALVELYSRQLGIPTEYNEPPLISGAAERLLVRAMVETVKACGWPVEQIPAAWETEPLTAQMALDAVDSFKSWRRHVPYNGTQTFAFAITSHLGEEAVPALLKMAAEFPKPLNWQQYRHAGECLVWLCHRHPHLKREVLAAWQKIKHPTKDNNSGYELATVGEALKRGAKHLWSNG